MIADIVISTFFPAMKKNVVSILLTKMPERNVTDKDIQTFKSII